MEDRIKESLRRFRELVLAGKADPSRFAQGETFAELESLLGDFEGALDPSSPVLNQFSRQLVNSAREGIIVYGTDLRYQVWSTFMEEITGFRAADVLGKHPLEIFPFLRDVGVFQKVERALKGESPEPSDFPYTLSNGRSGWVVDLSSPLRGVSGEIIGVVGTVVDVTARKKVEQSLLEQTTLLNAVVDNIPVGVFLKDVKDDFKVTLWNRAAERIFELPRETVLGKTIHEYRGKEVADKIHADDLLAIRDRLQLDFERTLPSASGDCKYARIRKVPITIGEGKEPTHLLAISDDITLQKKYADEVLNQKQLLETILNNLPNMIFVKDYEHGGRFTAFNKAGADLLGVNQEDMIGKNDYDLVPKEQADFFREKDREVFAAGRTFEIAQEPIDTPKGRRWLCTTKVPTFRADGSPDLLIGIATDITEELELQKQVDLERAKSTHHAKLASLGEMSAGIAHEINNPLAVIAGVVQNLPRYKDDPEKFASRVASLAKATQRIEKIVRGLQKLSRSSSGALYAEASLSKLVTEALVFTDLKANRQATLVTIDIQSKAAIFCDQVEIEQVLINLINNAIDAVRPLPEKWVKVSAFDDGKEVVLQVMDSGAGIPADVQQRIFEPFFTTKPVGEGTGLGLSICKSILEQHKASITVKKDCPNTCFEVRFRRAGSEAERAS